METLKLGRLNVRRFVKPGATVENLGDISKASVTPPLVLVLSHGFGAPGDDLVALSAELDVPPGTVMLFPEALHSLREFVTPLSQSARAWWMIDMARLERAIARKEARDLAGEVPEGLADARAAMNEMLDALGETVPLDRLVLGGFSQGAMLSLDVAQRNPERKLAGLVLLSGTLLAEREWAPRMAGRKGTPVFQSHGETDPVLPFSVAERLRDALTAAGLDVAFDPFPGPHTIPPRTLQRLGVWLRSLP